MNAQRLPASLWRQPNFAKLWLGQTVSLFGSQITTLALPLTAIVALQATPQEMGVLRAVQALPLLFFGLFAGAWLDRRRRRPVLIAADLGRALLLLIIPLAATLGQLSIALICLVALLTGTLTVFSGIAYQSLLPALVGQERLVEGNGKLEVGRSLAQILGPGLAGALVQLITAPLTLLFDSATFLFSAICLRTIRAEEKVPEAEADRPSYRQAISEGLRFVIHNPLLRGIAGCTGTDNFFSSILFTVYLLYVTHELRVDAATLGLTFTFLGPGALIGALAAERIARVIGVGFSIILGQCLGACGVILILLTTQLSSGVIVALGGAQFLFGLAGPIYNINQHSISQVITPGHFLGRMNATMTFIMWSMSSIGALLGGVLGAVLGLQTTLIMGGLGSFLAILWLIFSPLASLRERST
jgi:predicted MFS family arabinose efflux permease